MLIPVPGISTPLNLEINLLYCPPEQILPISTSLPLLLVALKFKFVSTLRARQEMQILKLRRAVRVKEGKF